MRVVSPVGTLVVMILLATGSAHASTILDVSSALSQSDPIQLGRLSRNLIAQDWSNGEPFPGVINPLVPYRYHVYSVNVGVSSYIQISFDSLSPDTFVSAYDTFYAPNPLAANLGLDVNWLGDAGLSGNDFIVDPLFFQVRIPQSHNLLIVVNNTAAGDVGIGDPFRVLVEGFIDTEFTDPPTATVPVPEPASLVLGATGLALTALRRRRASAAAARDQQ